MNRTARLERLYASLPSIACKGLCSDCCGPIYVNSFEWERMGRPQWNKASLKCPVLVEKRCSVYEVRPLICRLWGLVDEMPCPWGCKADRKMSEAEITAAWEEWRQISGTTKGPSIHLLDKMANEPRRLVGIAK